ncbi:MAG TPA: 30S ribosomal protein S4 [Thermoprotei archaeon]|nr:30S ribosomal protein S4 [Thermoprotei archaeon]
MGDPKKPRKKWEGPTHPWRKDVLLQELELIGKYGLRNKRELWKAKTFLRRIRNQAREIMGLLPEERERRERLLVQRLYRLGLVPSLDVTIDDILRLTVSDVLDRRLQVFVYKKGFAKSLYHARQLIVHGHILVNDHRVTSPGYMVKREEENNIRLALQLKNEGS